MCRIVTASRPLASLADLKPGDPVDVEYGVMDTGVCVADAITPPQQ